MTPKHLDLLESLLSARQPSPAPRIMESFPANSRAWFMKLGREYAGDSKTYLLVSPDTGLSTSAPIEHTGAGAYATAWSAEWARLAFPVIQPSHQYAAALMATHPPPSEIDVRAPWPTFYLAVPDNLVTLLNAKGEPEPVSGMLVHVAQDYWTWLATAITVEFSRVCFKLDVMREPIKDGAPPAWGNNEPHLELESEEHDERAAHCLSRLLINACLAMSDPTAVRTVGKAHRWRTGEALPSTPRIFELNRPVRVDCRDSVRQYIRGGASRLPSVQWLVRGHWRNQPHGPQHSLRRAQWIEPHWKGGEDAPLQIREHQLKG